ncbi:MAG TPA: AgmX/PglI C-terminal domain-containing protein [Polyangia bacterium]|nr:AgmX/PglI C-terminal domain-containing protein [Polyangia bacterium]
MNRRLALLVPLLAMACAKPPPPAPRTPATVVAAPAPAAPEPEVCYARDGASLGAGDIEKTDDPIHSVFVLDREMLPELARRLDHPSGAQKHSSLDDSIIQMVARRHADAVKQCSAARAAQPPGKPGTVTARFAIAADGQVTRARVANSTVGDAGIEDCIGREVCGWRFPALAGGRSLVLEYPFLVSPP